MNNETHIEIDALRECLIDRIGELRADLEEAAQRREDASSDEDATDVADRKDDAEQWRRSELDAESERVERDELRHCEQALRRIEQGVYGECTDCHQPLAPARLRVQPEAERCTACQDKHERRLQGLWRHA